jgi:hypothetical protein
VENLNDIFAFSSLTKNQSNYNGYPDQYERNLIIHNTYITNSKEASQTSTCLQRVNKDRKEYKFPAVRNQSKRAES